MSSLPSENLVDVLRPLDRWTLDTVQITSQRFRQLTVERMSSECLRAIKAAHFCSYTGRSWVKAVGRADRLEQLLEAHADFAGFFSAFLDAVRSSWIADLLLEGIAFTPELATLVSQTPITARDLCVRAGSCVELTPAQFHALVVHFSPTKLQLGPNPANAPRLRVRQLDDEFLQALAKNRLRRASLPKSNPVDGDRFIVTDDGIIDFCMQPDEPAGQGVDEQKPYTELLVSNGSFSKDIFKRMVEASAVSVRTQSLRIGVESVRLEDADLRDFEQRLSYRDSQKRIYNFPGERRGEDAAMDLQIVLLRETLFMIRAHRDSPHFFRSDGIVALSCSDE